MPWAAVQAGPAAGWPAAELAANSWWRGWKGSCGLGLVLTAARLAGGPADAESICVRPKSWLISLLSVPQSLPQTTTYTSWLPSGCRAALWCQSCLRLFRHGDCSQAVQASAVMQISSMTLW